jgi:isopenicillin-N epimerase
MLSSSSRRDFLKSAGLVTVATALPAGASVAQAQAMPPVAAQSQTASNLGRLQPHPTISAPRGTDAFWREVRSSFPLGENYIHMNTGTTGSVPLFAQNNLTVYNAYKSADPLDWSSNLAADFPDLYPIKGTEGIQPRQAAIAKMFGANEDEIVLTYNTTDGCNLVIGGIPWKAGDRIVVTNLEHNGMMGAVRWAADHHGVKIVTVPLPSRTTSDVTVDDILSLFEKELKADRPAGATQYVAFSEIPYKNGVRLPVKEIVALARSHGAFSIVDSAHSFGMLPVNLRDYGADFVAGAGHKWLCGGPGTGILYVRNSGDNLPPFALGNFRYQHKFFQNRNWSPAAAMQPRGEYNRPALLAMSDVAKYFDYIGTRDIHARGTELGNYLKDKVANRWGAEALWVQKSPDPRFATSLTAFNPFVTKDDSSHFAEMRKVMEDVVKQLKSNPQKKVYIRTSEWRDGQSPLSAADEPDRIGLRISTHAVYNNKEEIDLVFDQIAALIDKTGRKQLS